MVLYHMAHDSKHQTIFSLYLNLLPILWGNQIHNAFQRCHMYEYEI
jgi:hypothetical protein